MTTLSPDERYALARETIDGIFTRLDLVTPDDVVQFVDSLDGDDAKAILMGLLLAFATDTPAGPAPTVYDA